MPQVTEHAPGTPSWVDVTAPDVDAAVAFYAGLFGWEAAEAGPAEETGGYRMFHRGGRSIAGIGPVMHEGMPAVWTTYVTVADADAAVAAAREAGAQVHVEPMNVLTAGRMAVLADPEGAVFAVWEPREHIGSEIVGEPGALCWNELQTRDPEAAKAFYGAVFGWTGETGRPADDGPEYTMWQLGERAVGGMLSMDASFPEEIPPNWLTYIAVEDADAALARAQELGGSVMAPAMDTGAGRLAILGDPHGAVFGVIALSLEMREDGGG